MTGRIYVKAEQRLAPLTDGLIFESQFAARRFGEFIGKPACPVCIVPNGLYPHEFHEPLLAYDAADFVFVGELRPLKGVDIMLAALAATPLSTVPRRPRAGISTKPAASEPIAAPTELAA